MEGYHYVYTLESLFKPDEIYTGQTQELTIEQSQSPLELVGAAT